MKRLMMFLVLCLSLTLSAAVAAIADNSTDCQQCGMDITSFPQSRMVIVYADGTTVELCSLHCAAANMKQNKSKEVKSLAVADYNTKGMIGARTATWVVGGKEPGVMTSIAKWAFARAEDAQKFVKENGGKVTSFNDALKAADEELSEHMEMTHEH